MQKEQDKGIIHSWNALRFLFIWCVVYYHTNSGYFFKENLSFLAEYGGFLGNYFFFFISGILISKRCRSGIIKDGATLDKFIIPRILKFYPVYMLSELLIITWSVVNLGIKGISVTHLLTDALLITNGWFIPGNQVPYNFAAWFVCVLVLCYLLYFLICKLSRRSDNLYFLIITFMFILGLFLKRADLSIPFMYRTSGEGYMCFFAGAVSCHLWDICVKKHERLFHVISACVLAAIIIGTVLIGAKTLWIDEGIFVLLISGSCLLLAKHRKIQPFFKNQAVSFICGLSMEIYFLHLPLWLFYKEVIKAFGLVITDGMKYYVIYLITLTAIAAVVSLIFKRLKGIKAS